MLARDRADLALQQRDQLQHVIGHRRLEAHQLSAHGMFTVSGELMRFEAPMPDDMLELIALLEG